MAKVIIHNHEPIEDGRMENSILVIEDDPEINTLLCRAFEREGYSVKSVLTGSEGLFCLKNENFQIVLLDLMLPYKSGDQLLSELRLFSDIPVIVISAKETTQNKIDLLRLGADDYVTKPFDLDEVVARVEAALRRSRQKQDMEQQRYLHKDIQLDKLAKQVFVNGQELILTVTEYKILELLLSQPQKVFSKGNLYESIWSETYTVDDNTLNVHMSRLRRKLAKANKKETYIETLWGLGYRLKK